MISTAVTEPESSIQADRRRNNREQSGCILQDVSILVIDPETWKLLWHMLDHVFVVNISKLSAFTRPSASSAFDFLNIDSEGVLTTDLHISLSALCLAEGICAGPGRSHVLETQRKELVCIIHTSRPSRTNLLGRRKKSMTKRLE